MNKQIFNYILLSNIKKKIFYLDESFFFNLNFKLN